MSMKASRVHDVDGMPEPPAHGAWLNRMWAHVQRRLTTTWAPKRVVLFKRLDGDADAIDSAIEAFDQWCLNHFASVCELGLSSHWLHSCVVWNDESRQGATAQAIHKWDHYFGMSQAQLDSDWRLVQAAFRGDSLVCAAPGRLIEGLQSTAKRHRVVIQSVTPWWASAAQTWCDHLNRKSEPDTLVLCEPSCRTSLRLREQDGIWRLDQCWLESAQGQQGVAMGQARQARVLALPQPTAIAQGVPIPIWDHREMEPVLRGLASCFVESP